MAHISMGDVDLLHPPKELEQKRHKLKRLVQSPNSFFMDVKCPGCFNITTVFSHAQTVVLSVGSHAAGAAAQEDREEVHQQV